jgi:hypothetical protein
MTDNADELVTRQKRNPNKKTNWGEKSDKINHGKKTSLKRRLAEIADEDDDMDLREYTR